MMNTTGALETQKTTITSMNMNDNVNPILKDIMETLLLITLNDSTVDVVTDPVLKVIEGVTSLIKH